MSIHTKTFNAVASNCDAQPLKGRSNALLARRLLFAYFLCSFSYAHLPLATLHHSLGSLFNYVFFLIAIQAILVASKCKIFFPREVRFLAFSISALLILFLCQAIFVIPWLNGEGIFIRSAGSVASTAISYCGVFLALNMARYCGFTFKHLSAACFCALIFLLGYLLIETLGGQLELEPFASVVRLVSKYVNYRDEADALGGRVRGFSNEPSYLAIVVVFLVAILLVDKTRSPKSNYLLLILVLALSAASLSKNLLGGVMVILLVHAAYFRKVLPAIVLMLSLYVVLFVYTLTQTEGIQWQYEAMGYDISTVTRVGSWVAAWDGFAGSPVFGNGYGLAGGFLQNYYPDWFYLSPEAASWEIASDSYAAPVFSNFFRVLFESGLFGLIFVFGSIYFLTRASNSRGLLSHDNAIVICAFLLCFGMVDVMSYWPLYVALGIRRSSSEVR